MIVCISTSSPVVSCALFRSSGELIQGGFQEAPMRASGASIKLINDILSETDVELSDISIFAADVGPGSFTGVRVGVTIAKTLAFCFGAKCAAVSAFDLISSSKPVAIPCRKGQWHRRDIGCIERIVDESELGDCVGYGNGFELQTYPEARRANVLVQTIDPELLNPTYLVGPSISSPRRAYGLGT